MISYSSSSAPEAVLQKQIASLKKGVIDPSLHYRTLKQSRAWKNVFKRHCPVLRDPSFSQIYRSAFSGFSIPFDQKIHLIGLGCGTGVKEQWLAKALSREGMALDYFTAVDVSEFLCRMSIRRLRSFTVKNPQAWVMDLAVAEELRGELDQRNCLERRIYTLFGLVPNLEPKTVLHLLKVLLRKGDQLFISANLAPVKCEIEEEIEKGVRKILPQYRNQETREWLSLLFQEQKISKKMISALKFTIESEQGVKSVVVRREVLQNFEWVLGGRSISMKKGDSLKVFQSRRWTAVSFERWLKKNGFKVKNREITLNQEEGVWWVER